MGEVYEGRHLFTDNRVAIKMILRELSNDESIVGLFRREARILSDLADDAIVRYLDSFYHAASDRYCLVMQYIDGVPLADHLLDSGPLGEADARVLMHRLASGLHKVHLRGVVHRDLSPDNVMLRSGRVDRAALIDFGIATAEDQSEGTLLGKFAGKYRFVSPEQLGLFGGAVDARTDIHGLGLLLAAALRGKPLEMGRSFPEAVQARERVPDLDGVPQGFVPLLTAMLQPDPANRPADMQTTLRLLDAPQSAGDVAAVSDRTVISSPPTGVQLSRPPGAPRPAAATPVQGIGQPLRKDGKSDAPFQLDPDPQQAAVAAPPRRRRGAVLGAGAALLALGVAGWAWTVQRSDTTVDASLSSEPEQAETSLTEPVPEPTLQLAAPDLSTREGFLADYGAATPCSYATRITAGADVGRIGVFAVTGASLADLPNAYGEAFGLAPEIARHPVTDSQCPALTLARSLQGRGAVAPVLTLDADAVQSNGTVLGRLAQLRGRGVWLALVTAQGEVFDLSTRLEPQADGSFLFAFTLNAAAVTTAQPQLIVALASDDPLIATATATDGASADTLMPALLAEAVAAGAVAQIARFVLEP